MGCKICEDYEAEDSPTRCVWYRGHRWLCPKLAEILEKEKSK